MLLHPLLHNDHECGLPNGRVAPKALVMPGALGGTRTPNFLIRSKTSPVQISLWLSG